MEDKLRVFVSSVQKELEDARLLVQNLINTDQFLSEYCLAILFEFEPASTEKATDGCLRLLDECQVYILIVGNEYGRIEGDLSITHIEYRHAKENGKLQLVFIKGDRSNQRDNGIEKLLDEIVDDGLKYKRFNNLVEFQKEVRASLVKLLKDNYNIVPTNEENIVAEQTIEATSNFESKPLTRLAWSDLDHKMASRLTQLADGRGGQSIGPDELIRAMMARGLVHYDAKKNGYYATAAGILMLARDPSVVFPQVRILADAYRSTEPDGEPIDQDDIRGPLPIMIEEAIRFIDRNTRHPMKIIGLNRVRLDEYPTEALREVLVNAVAHRLYEDGGRRIMLEVFADRIIVSSPGMPPAPITIAKLNSGRYRPCSRNPLIAQSLSHFQKIEERGSGFRRIRDSMLNHGLDKPILSGESGYFQVTLFGPGDNLDRIHVPESQVRITPSIEAGLNERQRAALKEVLASGSVSSGWLVKEFKITYDTANRDLKGLAALGILIREGKGRATRYIFT